MIKTIAFLVTGILMGAPAVAQEFPSRPIALIVPAAAGGPSDVFARVLTERLRTTLGQSLVVENRGGANGTIGVASVARARPDGHTVLLTNDAPLTTIPALVPGVTYDASKDLLPVAILGDGGDVVLAVPASSEAKSPEELATQLRKNPASANYVSSGAGFPSHIVSEIFKRDGKFDAQHIPMRGAAAAITELLAGRASFYFPPASVAAVHAQAGKIRILAVASARRNALLPDVPTFAELGFKNIQTPGYWLATFVPAGTPPAVVAKLAAAIQDASHSPAYAEVLQKQGLVRSDAASSQIAARVSEETAYWTRTIRELGIKIE